MEHRAQTHSRHLFMDDKYEYDNHRVVQTCYSNSDSPNMSFCMLRDSAGRIRIAAYLKTSWEKKEQKGESESKERKGYETLDKH